MATNVYLDDMKDFAKMNRIYASYFKTPFPARTTVQQRPSVERKQNEREQWPDLEEISLVAVKSAESMRRVCKDEQSIRVRQAFLHEVGRGISAS